MSARSDSRIAHHQRGQRRAVAGRKCPACDRGNALTRHDHTRNVDEVAVNCRYCPYVRLRGQTVADAVERARRGVPVVQRAPMPRGGKREGAGRPDAFPGEETHRRAVRLPERVWARIDALAREHGTSAAGVVALAVGEHAEPVKRR